MIGNHDNHQSRQIDNLAFNQSKVCFFLLSYYSIFKRQINPNNIVFGLSFTILHNKNNKVKYIRLGESGVCVPVFQAIGFMW